MTDNTIDHEALKPLQSAVDKAIAGVPTSAAENDAMLYASRLYLALQSKSQGDVTDVLIECESYFDNKADADHDQDGYIPNEEMKLLNRVRAALASFNSKFNRGDEK